MRLAKDLDLTTAPRRAPATSPAVDAAFDEADPLEHAVERCLEQLRRRTAVSSPTSIDALLEHWHDTALPERPMSAQQYGELLVDRVVPHAVDVGQPGFFGHMTSPLPTFHRSLSRLGAALNQNVVKLETSKVFTALERQVLGTLHRLVWQRDDAFYREHLHAPTRALGVTTSGGTMSNITALWLARNEVLGMDGGSLARALQARGYDDAVIVGSTLAHYSLRKAASLLGLGTDNVVEVEVTRRGQMDVQGLDRQLERCREARLAVVAIVGLAGTTETGSIDDLHAIADRAQGEGIAFHVDAAWGGPLLLSASHRDRLAGIERADTVSMCGHKQLYLPQGMSVLLCRDPRRLDGIATTARYQAREGSWDLGARSAEGSRAPQCLHLHAALALLGRSGYGQLVDASIERARTFAGLVMQHPEFELLEAPHTNIVIYRWLPPCLRGATPAAVHAELARLNRINDTLQQVQFERGRSLVSRTTIHHGRHGSAPVSVLRAVFTNPRTDCNAMKAVLAEQASIGAGLEARGGAIR